MRILVLDDSITSLAFSLTMQSSTTINEIHMVSEKTEVGLSDSLKPGTNSNSHPLLLGIFRHMPKVTRASPFLRNSWVHRGLAIESVNNGLNLHFRSAVHEIGRRVFEFHGTASSSFGAKQRFDYVYHPSQAESGILWHGAVSTKPLDDEVSINRRWHVRDMEQDPRMAEFCNMERGGEEPNEAVAMAISEGVAEATRLLSSLK